MKIVHKSNKKLIEKEGEASFFISDRKGGYFTLGSSPKSNYEGWLTFLDDEWEMYKIIDNIKLKTKPKEIISTEDYILRNHDNATEKIFLKKDTLFYTIKNYDGPIELTVDFRRIHDHSDEGRIYEISVEKGVTIIKYTKFKDNTLSETREEKYLAIKGDFKIDSKNEWIKRNYSIDEERHVKSEFYIYHPFNLKINNMKKQTIVFSFSNSKEQAIKKCRREHSKQKTLPKLKSSKIRGTELKIACNALSNLTINLPDKEPAILAGFPWFYQVWSRDELISLTGLISQRKFNSAKKIVLRHLRNLNKEGIIGNRWPSSELGSADGIGWLYKRAKDLIDKKVMNKAEKKFVLEKIKETVKKTMESKMKNGLIWNNPLETWMDTAYIDGLDKRAGYRIEIQALYLNLYSLAKELSVNNIDDYKLFEKFEYELKQNVLQRMVKDDILYDGIDEHENLDKTIRPNIFLAYYIYPELLTPMQWRKTFDAVLKECWLSWGGLSSISKHSPMYQPKDTGINNKGYHRGDSWYYINNISAICLYKLDKHIYARQINKIKNAGINEMLFSGFIGQCSEISDAEKTTSKGCRAQAWSCGTLIELLKISK